jgi:hypothetical protein
MHLKSIHCFLSYHYSVRLIRWSRKKIWKHTFLQIASFNVYGPLMPYYNSIILHTLTTVAETSWHPIFTAVLIRDLVGPAFSFGFWFRFGGHKAIPLHFSLCCLSSLWSQSVVSRFCWIFLCFVSCLSLCV